MNKPIGLIFIWIWLLASASFIFLKGVFPAWQEERSDFSNYYVSAALLAKGEPISKYYDNSWFHEEAIELGAKDGAKFAPFPPATAFLGLPLSHFTFIQAKRIWMICNLLLMIPLFLQLKSITSFSHLEVAFLLSLFFIPIASNIRLGQSYLFFTSLLLSSLQALKNKKPGLGGIIIGFAAAFKYFPIVYFLHALPKFSKKAAMGLLGSIAFVSLLPLFTHGIAPYSTFIQIFWEHANGNLSGQGQFATTFQSIDALLANLFIYDADLNPNAVFDLPKLKGVLKLLFAGMLVWISIKAFRQGVRKTKDLSIAICILAASLLIPASATYHLLLLIPAILLLLNFMRNKGQNNWEVGILILLTFISCNLLPHHIPTLEFNHSINTLIHFPRLYGLLSLFAFSLYLQKRHLQNHG